MYQKGKKRVYTGKVIHVDEVQLDFPDHPDTVFEIVSFDVVTGVSALPIVDDQVMLIKHYQAGIDTVGWSLPTGGLEAGEDPEKRMQEELQEEIGYKAGRLTLMVRSHTLPGYIGSEAGYLFLAEDLLPSSLPGDEPYPIESVTMPIKKALRLCRSGDIADARTLLALLYYVQFNRHG